MSENPKLEGKTLLEAAKTQAALNLKGHGDPLTHIRIWWTKKYHRSPNSEEFKSYTFFQLLTEFFEDYFEQKPEEMKPLDLPASKYGDDVIDKWEREIEQGLSPDLLEDLTPEQGSRLRAWSKRVHELKRERGMLDFDSPKPILGSDEVYKEEF